MKRRQILSFAMIASAILFVSACATDGTMSSESSASSSSTAATAEAPATGPGRAAAGASGDTQQACLHRIPRDASAGQRMMAEETCKRDEATRKSITVVPGK